MADAHELRAERTNTIPRGGQPGSASVDICTTGTYGSSGPVRGSHHLAAAWSDVFAHHRHWSNGVTSFSEAASFLTPARILWAVLSLQLDYQTSTELRATGSFDLAHVSPSAIPTIAVFVTADDLNPLSAVACAGPLPTESIDALLFDVVALKLPQAK